MVLLAPVNIVVFSIVSTMRRKVLKYSDLRVKMMNEILTGIRIIKFYAWEKPFGKEVGRLRQKELEALTKLAYTTAVGFSIILLSTPIIQPIIVFLTYVKIQDEPLSASTAFTTVALFNIMRFPFAFMPMGLLQYIQSKISLKRLERYLALPELQGYVEDAGYPETPDDSPMAKSGSITIKDASFSWSDPDAPEIRPVQDEKPKKEKKKKGKRRGSVKNGADDEEESDASRKSVARSQSSVSLTSTESGSRAGGGITLQNINCEIEPGSLVAVVGSVGSGKSSFLSAILGEMESIGGSKVYIPRNGDEKDMNGYASYCTQSPWVVNDTLRGNILFGREYDEERYIQVLDCCALVDDIAILPAGDMTEIGERGINLSGGQKARVALARAMYAKQTRLLLLDDPLSAVDSHVGEHIFSKAIAGDISKGVTRILVTHHVHVLSRCDKVIVFDHGRITHQGEYRDLIASGVDFAGAVDVSKLQKSEKKEASKEDKKVDKTTTSKKKGPKEDRTQLKTAGAQLVKEEEREKGDVASQAYVRYAKAGGLMLTALVFLVQAFGRACEIGASFWLAHWADKMIEGSVNKQPLSDSEVSFYIGIYALLGFLGICGLGGRGIAVARHRLRASKKLHDGITDSVMRAPVAFFDITPIGRILNRFAADMDKLDLELTQTVSQGVSTVFSVLGALGAIVAATKGSFLVALIPLGYTYNVVQKWFRKTSTELQRVTSVSNSPIFADFSQTLSGTSTIRAYGVQHDFFNKCKGSFDNMNASYVLVQLAGYWLALRLDIMGGVISMFIGIIAVSTLDSGFIPAGWLGLALSYSIEVTSYLKHGVMMIARLEADMSSVERILFYTDKIEPEAPDEIPEKDPEPGTWPSKGEIEFSNTSMRYRDGPLVLKDLSLTVKGGEKIGVCGRTGSGKSSLMISLFRITEIEDDGGQILIDGVNAKEIGTAALRLNLSIIPQDPVMFSNTVRYNLDPFAKATDEELWEVLKKVRLGEVIAELPKGLDEEVAEGGENFSQGQRQLLCIARSLLRKPKILVMDEATASIDNETDAAIQEMIRENFADATILTIAHRLNTIMDSDRVLVLDEGRVAELDTPENLLADENSHFRAMVDKSRAAHSNSIDEE
jgi:ATP-binding cassette subfamily C (CFTR/MRP) protein 1